MLQDLVMKSKGEIHLRLKIYIFRDDRAFGNIHIYYILKRKLSLQKAKAISKVCQLTVKIK